MGGKGVIVGGALVSVGGTSVRVGGGSTDVQAVRMSTIRITHSIFFIPITFRDHCRITSDSAEVIPRNALFGMLCGSPQVRCQSIQMWGSSAKK